MARIVPNMSTRRGVNRGKELDPTTSRLGLHKSLYPPINVVGPSKAPVMQCNNFDLMLRPPRLMGVL